VARRGPGQRGSRRSGLRRLLDFGNAGDVAVLAVLLGLKGALGAWVLHAGFSHVSDDDYSRVVIAQLFAHAPKLNPSGTSWLPFPFWAVGSLMMLAGRSLHAAQVIAFATGCASIAPVYLALRKAGVLRACAALGVALAMATPWNAWLAVATVPEAPTGALIACGAILLGVPDARPIAAAGLLVAALSRYEAWPVCGVFALVCAWSATRAADEHDRWRDACCAAIAAAGPLAWMAWNAHAHDGALHFLRRVATFRSHMAPAAGAPMLSFPRALVTGAPEIAVVALLGGFGLGDEGFRKRWTLPLLCVAALVLFLMIGDWQGGAPTHHPERALVGAWWILAASGVDGIVSLGRRWAWGRPKREAWGAAAATAGWMTWSLAIPRLYSLAPGMAPGDDRREQLARGESLAAQAGSVEVTPCVYEHFALLAAYGAPEQVTVDTADPHGEPCPGVVVR
jgi:hypothetical protein